MAPTVMASSATSVVALQGLKSTVGLPVSRRSTGSGFGNVSNGGRIRCTQIWPAENNKKLETLSYLPPLSQEDLLKQIDYLLPAPQQLGRTPARRGAAADSRVASPASLRENAGARRFLRC